MGLLDRLLGDGAWTTQRLIDLCRDHSMHHRAQLRYMLRQLGLKDLPGGDALSWERHLRDR